MAVDKFLVVVVLTVDHNYKLHISTKFYEGFDSSLRDDWQWFKELAMILNSDLTVSAHCLTTAKVAALLVTRSHSLFRLKLFVTLALLPSPACLHILRDEFIFHTLSIVYFVFFSYRFGPYEIEYNQNNQIPVSA